MALDGSLPKHPGQMSHRRPEAGPKGRQLRRTKKLLFWIGGIVTALVTGLAVAFGTGVGNGLFKSASSIAVSTGPPLSVSLYHETMLDNPGGGGFGTTVFPGKLNLTKADLQAINTNYGTGIVHWLAGRGGYEEYTELKLTVTGRRNCRILNMRADILSRTPPVDGTLFQVPVSGTGGSGSVSFSFNLDSSSPVALAGLYYPGSNSSEYFQANTFTLAPGEQDTFQIFASTNEFAVRWVIDITILDGSKIVQDVVSDNGGVPFRTSAVAPITQGAVLTGVFRQYAENFYKVIYTECSGLGPASDTGLDNAQCQGTQDQSLWVKAK